MLNTGMRDGMFVMNFTLCIKIPLLAIEPKNSTQILHQPE